MMENVEGHSTAAGEMPPIPRSGFETEVIQELEALVAELSPGIATFRLSRVPLHPDWTEPFFEIIPANPRSASLSGVAIHGDLSLTIGEVEREFIAFHKGGNIIRGASWRDELRWIWQAVVVGGFSQRQSLGAKGNVLGGASVLAVNGKEFVYRGGRRAETLFGKRRYRTVIYEPYR
jgi:hypothetical protein